MQRRNSDVDCESEFFTALALLKSSDKNSAVKLRDMLLNSITRRNFYFDFNKIPVPNLTYSNSNPIYCKYKNNSMEGQFRNNKYCNLMQVKSTERIGNNMLNEDVEIPTISIPDEEFIDSAICKVCGGVKIGPLILLECQNCQDAYHPLCHQPPVVDIDIYDPSLIWRCNRCFEIFKMNNKGISINSVKSLTKKLDNQPNQEDFHENIETKRKFQKIKTYSSRKKKLIK